MEFRGWQWCDCGKAVGNLAAPQVRLHALQPPAQPLEVPEADVAYCCYVCGCGGGSNRHAFATHLAVYKYGPRGAAAGMSLYVPDPHAHEYDEDERPALAALEAHMRRVDEWELERRLRERLRRAPPFSAMEHARRVDALLAEANALGPAQWRPRPN